MASIEELEKERQFYDSLMAFLPANETDFEVQPHQKPENPPKQKEENIPKPKPVQQNRNMPKQKPKNKPNPIRPGFEGPKFIKKKREEKNRKWSLLFVMFSLLDTDYRGKVIKLFEKNIFYQINSFCVLYLKI